MHQLKDRDFQSRSKKRDPTICCPQEIHFKYKDTYRLKVNGWNIGWMDNKVLLYSTGNCIQCPWINHNGKEYKKEMCIYIYICIYM